MRRSHNFYQFFCQKSNIEYGGMGWGHFCPSIIYRHFTCAIQPPHPWVLQLLRVYCAFSYPDGLGKAGLSCPDWLRPDDSALAGYARHCSWKPSSHRIRDSTVDCTFLWAYGLCKDPRLGNESLPPECFVSYTLGWWLSTPRLSLIFFICIVFLHIFSELLHRGALPFYFSIMWLAFSVSHFSSLTISGQLQSFYI